MKRAVKSTDAMAFSDVIERNIRSTNNWSMLGLQAYYSTVMPSYYTSAHLNVMPMFPSILGRMSNYNKRDRLLQELKTHMNLKISGSKSALNLDYLQPLCERIARPMANGDVDGAADVLNNYHLRKEDIDIIMELAQFKGDKDPLAKVDSKTKAALTRKMNKEGEMLPYAYGTGGAKKAKGAKAEDDLSVLNEDEEDAAPATDDEKKDPDDIDEDGMIKKVARKAKKEPAKKEPKAKVAKEPKETKSTRGRKKK